MDNYLINLVGNFLIAVELGNDSTLFRRELYFLKERKLFLYLNTDNDKKIFWTTLHSAFVLLLLSEKVDQQEMYQIKRIKIARQLISLDDIEYNILRLGSSKSILSKFNSFFLSDFFKQCAVDVPDYSAKVQFNKELTSYKD
jgi:hypothetical protein